MPQKNLPDLIMELLNREGKPFMTVKHLAFLMNTEIKRDLGIYGTKSATEIRKAIEPLLEDKFIFYRKGPSLYIIVPCQPEDLILAELSKGNAKSPKVIGRSMPFTKKDCSQILRELESEGRIKIVINDTLETRVFLADKLPENQPVKAHKENIKTPTPYKVEDFKNAFDALDNGRIFVRICDLRRKLNWPRQVFDDMLKDLRDNGAIQLHAGDASLMTVEEVNDCFVDENHFRMGTVTWHDK